MNKRFEPHRFEGVWRDLGLTPSPQLFTTLAERYAEPHRAYHTAQHIDECLAYVDLARTECERPAEIELALWFHDAIYDTRASDNERRSADWCTRELASAGAPATVAASVHALIMATRHDAVPAGHDEQLLTDIDLSILGASRERFDEYETQVRIEYEWVPAAVFRTERAKVLRHFLSRPAIYATPFFRDRLEANARRNLTASLEQLAL